MTSDNINGLEKDDAFQRLSKKLNVYCPFAALGVEGQEIRHSNFLADILNPHKPHDFGNACLCRFVNILLEIAGKREYAISEKDDLSQVCIYREHRGIVERGRIVFIDLAIEIPSKKLVLVIEVKVGAGEHGTQLEDYEKVAKQQWKGAEPLFFFLTPDSKKPSREEIWQRVSFGKVVDGLECVLKKGLGDEKARMMLRAYIDMIRRRGEEESNDLNDLARQIWQKHEKTLTCLRKNRPDHFLWQEYEKVLNFLMGYRFDAISEISSMLNAEETAKRLTARLKEDCCKLNVVVDYDIRYTSDYNPNSAYHALHFAVDEWDAIDGMIGLPGRRWTKSKRVLLIEIRNYGSSNAMSTLFVVGPGPQDVKKKFIYALLCSRAVKRDGPKDLDGWTKLGHHDLRTKQQMQNTARNIANSQGETDINKIRKEFIDYWAAIIPKIHEAFIKQGML